MLRMSSSTISTFLPGQRLVGQIQVLEHRRGDASGSLTAFAVEQQRALVEQALRASRRWRTNAVARRDRPNPKPCTARVTPSRQHYDGGLSATAS